MSVTKVKEYGNQFVVLFDDGSNVTAYPISSEIWLVNNNMAGLTHLQKMGNQLTLIFADASRTIAYQTVGTNLWFVGPNTATGGGVPGTGTGWQWPLDKTVWAIVSEYGMRVNPVSGIYTMHWGLDISGSGITGTPIKAAFEGIVTFAGPNGGFGNFVEVEHPDGSRTRHAHMVDGSIAVSVGDSVIQGATLGGVGSTGNVTGPHLHWETKNSATTNAINPRDFMTARGNTW